MIFVVLLGLLLFFPVSASAIHQDVPPYVLLVEKPALEFKESFEKELTHLTPSEVYEYAEREERENAPVHHLMPELMRSLDKASNEVLTNAILILTEEVEFFGKLRAIYDKFGHPHADMKLRERKVEVSVRKPPAEPQDGFRLSISHDFEYPSSPAEFFLPTLSLKCNFGSFICRIRYKMNQTVQLSILAEPKNWEKVRLQGMLEYDLEETRRRAEFTVAKELSPLFNPLSKDYGALLKFRFRWEQATKERDFFWCRNNCWEVALFFSAFFD